MKNQEHINTVAFFFNEQYYFFRNKKNCSEKSGIVYLFVYLQIALRCVLIEDSRSHISASVT